MSEEIILWQQGFVKGFKLTPYDQNLYASILGQYEGRSVVFCVKSAPKRPSKEMHGYYRGVLLPAAQNSEQFRGWTLDEIHKYFTSNHLRDVIEKQMGGATVFIVTTQSTGDVTKSRMSQFIDAVKKELSELNISFPEPVKQINQL